MNIGRVAGRTGAARSAAGASGRGPYCVGRSRAARVGPLGLPPRVTGPGEAAGAGVAPRPGAPRPVGGGTPERDLRAVADRGGRLMSVSSSPWSDRGISGSTPQCLRRWFQ